MITLQSAYTVSSGVAVTAAHCFAGRNIKVMRLLVGEHDVKKALETRFTRSLIIVKVKLHENFNSTSNDNDIALVFIEGKITFNDGVGPSCLPILYASILKIVLSFLMVGRP